MNRPPHSMLALRIAEDSDSVIHGCLSTADLQQITGYQRAGDIERCLSQQGVRTFRGKDGPWTTIDLINAAGGLRQSGNDGMYEGPTL